MNSAKAHEDGALIRERHDPDAFHSGLTDEKYRTVVSDDAKSTIGGNSFRSSRYCSVKASSKFDRCCFRASQSCHPVGKMLNVVGPLKTSEGCSNWVI